MNTAVTTMTSGDDSADDYDGLLRHVKTAHEKRYRLTGASSWARAMPSLLNVPMGILSSVSEGIAASQRDQCPIAIEVCFELLRDDISPHCTADSGSNTSRRKLSFVSLTFSCSQHIARPAIQQRLHRAHRAVSHTESTPVEHHEPVSASDDLHNRQLGLGILTVSVTVHQTNGKSLDHSSSDDDRFQTLNRLERYASMIAHTHPATDMEKVIRWCRSDRLTAGDL